MTDGREKEKISGKEQKVRLPASQAPRVILTVIYESHRLSVTYRGARKGHKAGVKRKTGKEG